jgi:hypothetical protein
MNVRLNVPEEAWHEVGWNVEGPDRLLAQVNVCGAMHHLEAYLVEDRDDGYVCLANADMERDLMPKLQEVYDGAYETTEIRGRRYVLFMFPHAA